MRKWRPRRKRWPGELWGAAEKADPPSISFSLLSFFTSPAPSKIKRVKSTRTNKMGEEAVVVEEEFESGWVGQEEEQTRNKRSEWKSGIAPTPLSRMPVAGFIHTPHPDPGRRWEWLPETTIWDSSRWAGFLKLHPIRLKPLEPKSGLCAKSFVGS